MPKKPVKKRKTLKDYYFGKPDKVKAWRMETKKEKKFTRRPRIKHEYDMCGAYCILSHSCQYQKEPKQTHYHYREGHITGDEEQTGEWKCPKQTCSCGCHKNQSTFSKMICCDDAKFHCKTPKEAYCYKCASPLVDCVCGDENLVKESWEERFDAKFELHDLGKDEFTLCCNNGDETCDGGISISKDNEKEAETHLKKVKAFIKSQLQQVREDAKLKDRMRLVGAIEKWLMRESPIDIEIGGFDRENWEKFKSKLLSTR